MAFCRLLFCWLLAVGLALPVQAQTELAQARASLEDVRGFYLSVNVEAGLALSEQAPIRMAALRGRLHDRLRAAGLTVWVDESVPPALRYPSLYLHLNVLDAGRGLVPFNVELQFYQRVRLSGGSEVPAATWSHSSVGLVSLDRLGLIGDTAAELTEIFIDDFRQTNP